MAFDLTPRVAVNVNSENTGKIVYGGNFGIEVRIDFPGVSCTDVFPVPAETVLAGSISFTANGFPLEAPLLGTVICTGSSYVTYAFPNAEALPFGTYDLIAQFRLNNPSTAAASSRATIAIEPAATLTSASGRGTIRVGIEDALGISDNAEHTSCELTSAVPVAIGGDVLPSTPSANLSYGALRLTAQNCSHSCGFLCPGGYTLMQRVLLGFDEDLPPGTVAWAYGPTKSDPTAHWYELKTSISGPFAVFNVVDGAEGDDGVANDNAIHATIAVGQPRYSAIPGSFQDLWWGGPSESGWGMNITQHRDVLVATLFIYDANGAPRWLIMPGGQWNSGRTAYTGNLYRPKGAPYNAYDASAFSPRSPVGTATLAFSAYGSATLDYTIDGVHGTRALQRMPFGTADPFVTPPADDLWWAGPSQDGWGLALSQHYRTVFGVLFTYDAAGEPVWFVAGVAPIQTDRTSFASKLYRTHGSPWVGQAYDASTLVIDEVGTLVVGFFLPVSSPAGLAYTIDSTAIRATISRQPF